MLILILILLCKRIAHQLIEPHLNNDGGNDDDDGGLCFSEEDNVSISFHFFHNLLYLYSLIDLKTVQQKF